METATAADKPGQAKVEAILAGTHAAMGKAMEAAEANVRAPAAASPAAAAAQELVSAPDLELFIECLFAIPGAFVTDEARRAAVDRLWQMDPQRRALMARAARVLVLKYGHLWMEHAPLLIFAVGMGFHVAAAGVGTVRQRRAWAREDAAKAAAPAAPKGESSRGKAA